MAPPFDAVGNLPPGTHALAVDEVFASFGTGSPRREWLAARLKALLDLARESGLVRRVYLWGSFVTAKASPNDLDVLLVLAAGLQDQDLAGPIRTLLDHQRARLRFHADVFWVPEEVGDNIVNNLLDTYMVDREKRRRGIVEVRL